MSDAARGARGGLQATPRAPARHACAGGGRPGTSLSEPGHSEEGSLILTLYQPRRQRGAAYGLHHMRWLEVGAGDGRLAGHLRAALRGLARLAPAEPRVDLDCTDSGLNGLHAAAARGCAARGALRAGRTGASATQCVGADKLAARGTSAAGAGGGWDKLMEQCKGARGVSKLCLSCVRTGYGVG